MHARFTHTLLVQSWFGMHALHAMPRVPQAATSVPSWHVPSVAQQPAQVALQGRPASTWPPPPPPVAPPPAAPPPAVAMPPAAPPAVPESEGPGGGEHAASSATTAVVVLNRTLLRTALWGSWGHRN